MNNLQLQSQLKTTGTAYLFFFLGGAHYIYLGNIGKQILFWCTFGGIGVWWMIDMFTLGDKVNTVNTPIMKKMSDNERDERDEKFKKDMMMMQAMKNA